MEGQEEANEDNLKIQEQNSAFNAEQAALTRQFNAEEAHKKRYWDEGMSQSAMNFSHSQAQNQMAYQSEMANTAWQRGIKDMQAAGLNPMLAYRQGGAISPSGAAGHGAQGSGAAASSSAASAGPPGNMQNTMAAAGASATQWAHIENIKADTARKEAETKFITTQDRGYAGEQDVRVDLMRKQAEQQVKLADLTHEQRKRVEKEIDLVLSQTKNQDADTALKKVNEVLQKYDIPRMEAESRYFKTPVGRESPHNKYGPQSPFRLIEGLGERIINRWGANDKNPRLYPPEGGNRKPW